MPLFENIQTVYSASVTLTDAQIKALPTTAIQVVAAQGAGKVIFPIASFLRCDTLLDGYTNFNANAGLHLAAGAVTKTMLGGLVESATGSQKVSTLLGAFDDVFSVFLPQHFHASSTNLAGVLSTTDYTNQPLKLYLDNQASGNLTGGNAANSLKVTVLYTVIEV